VWSKMVVVATFHWLVQRHSLDTNQHFQPHQPLFEGVFGTIDTAGDKCLGVWMFACVWYANSAETLSVRIRIKHLMRGRV
jgi:hypothetical protein